MASPEPHPYLSVIIPAYNEAERIERTTTAVSTYLRSQPYTYEIIIVNDGSNDSTGDVLKSIVAAVPYVLVLTHAHNQGKGAAVRTGMQSAHGAVRLFTDADDSTAIEEIEKLLPYSSRGYGVVLGSRIITGARKVIRQDMTREFLGFIFRCLVRILAPTGVIDTQNGFKLFTKESAELIFSELHTSRWAFDVEVLVRAKKFGIRIAEVPIVWANDPRSKLTFREMMRMFFDLIHIRTRYTFK